MSITPDYTSPAVTDPASLISPVIEGDAKSTIRHGAHVNWSFAAAAWLTLISTPLLFFPRILSVIFASLLITDAADGEVKNEVIRQLNVLERSMAGFAGFSCLAFAAVLVVQTGALPLTSSLSASSSIAQASSQAPFRAPTILIGTSFFAALAWYSYDLGMWAAAGPSAAIGVWGLWALLFAHEGRVNREGGPDNDKSYMKQKMEEKDL